MHINSLNWSSLRSMHPACGAWGWRLKGRIPVVKMHRRKITQWVRGSYSHKRTSLSSEGHHGCMQPGGRWMASLHSLLALCQAEHTSWQWQCDWWQPAGILLSAPDAAMALCGNYRYEECFFFDLSASLPCRHNIWLILFSACRYLSIWRNLHSAKP